MGVSRPIFRSLEVSPITAWLVARTAVAGGRSGGAKITHSEGNGAYDQMLLEMANGYSVPRPGHRPKATCRETLSTFTSLFMRLRMGRWRSVFAHSEDARYAGIQRARGGVDRSRAGWQVDHDQQESRGENGAATIENRS